MLTALELRAYEEQGYVVCPGLLPRGDCDALTAHLSTLIARIAAEYVAGTRHELGFWELMTRSRDRVEVFWDGDRSSPREGLEPATTRVGHALHAADPAFASLCASKALTARLREVVGEQGSMIQSAVIYKQPRSDRVQFGMHQDASYLTTEPESLALAFIALDDMNPENGCLEVVPRSHLDGLGVVLEMGPNGFSPVRGQAPRSPSRELATPLVLEKGSVVFLHGRTYHGSEPNRSDSPRRALIVHAMGGHSRLAPTSWVMVNGQPPPLVPL
jgi:phytanoyl-CoA hydroxylase